MLRRPHVAWRWWTTRVLLGGFGSLCDLKPGVGVTRGQRVGIIKFSSRVDLFLPGNAEVAVVPGDRTRAGETVVAVIPGGPRS